MTLSLNLHRLLHTADGYLAELKVPDPDASRLRIAREKIRTTLRAAFAHFEPFIQRTELFEGVVAKANVPALRPRFRLQGSWAYHTANDCQQTPPQQIDQDDGMFLPVSFLRGNGRVRPSVVSDAYFALVERSLEPLCQREGWRIKQKDTCVRVIIGDRLHIDIPLYAIQDDKFRALVEKSLARATVLAEESAELDEQVYASFDDSDIMLAHRVDGWVASDPRALEDWFAQVLSVHNEQVRRVVRSLKGLRDATWMKCSLSSIAIMKLVADAYDRINRPEADRDDLALLAVMEKMADLLPYPIENPAFPGQSDKNLDKDWDAQFRQQVVAEFSNRAALLRRAIFQTIHNQVAIDHLTSAFGDRIPNKPHLIQRLGESVAVRSVAAQSQAKPMPPRSTSG